MAKTEEYILLQKKYKIAKTIQIVSLVLMFISFIEAIAPEGIAETIFLIIFITSIPTTLIAKRRKKDIKYTIAQINIIAIGTKEGKE